MLHRRYCVPLLLALLAACRARIAVGDGCVDECTAGRESCTSGCADLVGGARGACLRACTEEFNRCKAACGPPPSTPTPTPDPIPFPEPTPNPIPSGSGPSDPECVSGCRDSRNTCIQDCRDQTGAARGACLAECRREYVSCVKACPPAPLPPADSVLVELAWDEIKAIDDGESGAAEPYMWTAFFTIDTTNTELVAGKLKVKSGASLSTLAGNGGHGNLPTIKSGQTKSVSSTFTFTPLLRPFTPFGGVKVAIVGSISVLMEEDAVSDSAAMAGAKVFRNEVEKLLQKLVNEMSLSEGVMLPDLTSGIKAIQKAVVNAIKDEQSFFENLGTFFGSPDDFLGSKVVIASVADGVPGGIAGTTNIPMDTSTSVGITSKMNAGGDGKWRLYGHVRRVKNN